MNIYVILKRTFDTEEKIQISNGEIVEDGAEFIINPYDEYAIEEAIQLRDEHGGEVTLVTVGEEEAEKQLRTGLAMGADKAVLIDNEEVENQDPYTTQALLAAYFEDKDVDIILGGNIAVDGGSGQVGPRLAEKLGIVHVTSIVKIDIADGKATIERDVEGDQEIVEVSLPVLVTAQQGLNEPRYPSLPGIMKAKKKPLETLEADDFDLDEDDVAGKTKTVDRYLPPEKQAGKVLEGEVDDQVKELVSLLKNEAKVI
ncbi:MULTISPECIES: electron transfer flavoprotein subunit beta/FixA family protein [Alteribacter]|uniref:Electron transfer flavoprotein subunit beta n=1 Tax=Alteribacter keqinensis TaxID=2483800 RepID=A0A3M7TYC1_9BACI|nr:MULTISPECIES: electron transfer flavoprotein subunit beta/FixA family protein [Alteribacter]MBM7096523.1 electron transfer flavoprotein subunit beta/FixA family protein [Alteribacter salitolerans]RNA70269.1 electron transfer flavoprotein subunit beta/FixA family protein [Alteribacter keqinensis]